MDFLDFLPYAVSRQGLENRLNMRWREWCQENVQPHLWQQAYPVFDGVIAPRYNEKNRKYHTLEHIADCLQKIDDVALVWKKGNLDNPENYLSSRTAPVLELAFWFHDIVYDTHRHDNEEQSVTIMQEVAALLQLPESFSKEAAELILCSQIKAVPQNDLQKLQKDIDYSIMGSPASMYDVYAKGIREENNWVEEQFGKEVYQMKRANFLEKTLKRAEEQGLFYTRYFQNMYGAAARENIKRELKTLRGERDERNEKNELKK